MDRLTANKIMYNVDRLLELKRRGDTYPVHMQVGLTDYCNHKCIFCYTDAVTGDTTRLNAIDKDVLIHFLNEAWDYGLKAVTLIGTGEPLLHPDICDILYTIKKIGLEIGIYTNGSRLKGEVADAVLDTCTFVRVSINAASKVEHEAVHGVRGQFEQIVNNIKELVIKRNEKRTVFPTIGTQFVFFSENYRSICDATILWKSIGVDYIAIKPLIDGEGNAVNKVVFPVNDVQGVIKVMKEATDEEEENFKVYAKYEQFQHTRNYERQYGICYGHTIDANLLADGNLTICCNLFNEEHIIGNIYRESFMKIWDGERRKKVVSSIDLHKCPKACRCDPLNEVVWDYLNPNPSIHPNFV